MSEPSGSGANGFLALPVQPYNSITSTRRRVGVQSTQALSRSHSRGSSTGSVVGVPMGTATIECRAIRRIEWLVFLDALDKGWISNEQAAASDGVRVFL